MNDMYKKTVMGAMLHDVGKVVQRAFPGEGSHGTRGIMFLSEILDKDKWKEVFDCIAYHHAAELNLATLDRDSPAYIVYEADNIAAGVDRRKSDSETMPGFEKYVPLHSVFNVFSCSDNTGYDSDMAYALRTMEESLRINFPDEKKNIVINPDKYLYILNNFYNGLKEINFESDSIDSLLKLLETVFAYVPSSTAVSEIPDISLFSHLKITAAIAGCFFRYFESEGVKDYRKSCFENPSELRKKKSFLLVSGDLSGIQNFIYTITSKGAMKSLRGRSFYLEMFIEHVIDELLSNAGLCRANLIYSGGGHFYILMPNTQRSINILETAMEKLNGWLAKEYNTRLYIAIHWCPADADQLGNGLESTIKRENMVGALFRDVSSGISQRKLQRYTVDQLKELMQPGSAYNLLMDAARECAVCGISNYDPIPLHNDDEDSPLVCENCRAFYMIGDRLARLGKINEKEIQVLSVKKEGLEHDGPRVPTFSGGEARLVFETIKDAEKGLKNGENIKVYSINRYLTGMNYSTNLWAGTYCSKSSKEYGLVDFEELAMRSKGIKRIGILRADVDNLGKAFISGFEKGKDKDNRYQFISLSRHAALSYSLSMFFKFEINKLCSGTAGFKQFSLESGTYKNTSEAKELVIVYSGGDDVFIAGAWNEVLEFSVDLRESFRKFTNSKMTLSAGVGIFDHKFPVAYMSKTTGILEKYAKENTGKDSISLFGLEYEGGVEKNNHTYKWDRFINNICGEKLSRLNNWIDLSQSAEPGRDKLSCSTAFIYKLLELYRSINMEGKDKIHIARLAYTLARVEPKMEKENQKLSCIYKEMREALYYWALSAEDCREFITALNIMIYLNRKENDNE